MTSYPGSVIYPHQRPDQVLPPPGNLRRSAWLPAVPNGVLPDVKSLTYPCVALGVGVYGYVSWFAPTDLSAIAGATAVFRTSATAAAVSMELISRFAADGEHVSTHEITDWKNVDLVNTELSYLDVASQFVGISAGDTFSLGISGSTGWLIGVSVSYDVTQGATA